MDAAFVFLLGMLCGSGLVVVYGWYQVNKLAKVKDSLLTQIKAKAKEMDDKKNTIKDRLTKASELAQAQMAIRAQMEMPSQNSLHSKYKNDLIGELHDMEAQKLDLLRTVLAEGFDPLITVINEGGTKSEIPLSAYVNEAAGLLDRNFGTQPPTPPTSDPAIPKKSGKFMVYKGGKDDGTTH